MPKLSTVENRGDQFETLPYSRLPLSRDNSTAPRSLRILLEHLWRLTQDHRRHSWEVIPSTGAPNPHGQNCKRLNFCKQNTRVSVVSRGSLKAKPSRQLLGPLLLKIKQLGVTCQSCERGNSCVTLIDSFSKLARTSMTT